MEIEREGEKVRVEPLVEPGEEPLVVEPEPLPERIETEQPVEVPVRIGA